jgi:hypothetical protein
VGHASGASATQDEPYRATGYTAAHAAKVQFESAKWVTYEVVTSNPATLLTPIVELVAYVHFFIFVIIVVVVVRVKILVLDVTNHHDQVNTDIHRLMSPRQALFDTVLLRSLVCTHDKQNAVSLLNAEFGPPRILKIGLIHDKSIVFLQITKKLSHFEVVHSISASVYTFTQFVSRHLLGHQFRWSDFSQ